MDFGNDTYMSIITIIFMFLSGINKYTGIVYLFINEPVGNVARRDIAADYLRDWSTTGLSTEATIALSPSIKDLIVSMKMKRLAHYTWGAIGEVFPSLHYQHRRHCQIYE